MRVADYIMSFFKGPLKADTVFMVSGGGIMHLTDALGRQKGLRYVCCHNEQAVTMAADGYAKTRNAFGAALLTTGPGATNAITGVVGAWQDSSRVFVVSGQSKYSQTIHKSGLKGLRQFGVQEADILPMVRTVTKYSAMVERPEDVRYHLEKAMYLAGSGRPGPVWIDVPLDVQGAPVDPKKLRGFDPEAEGFAEPLKAPAAADIQAVVKALRAASRPVIVAGQGVRIAGAAEKLARFAERNGLPVVTPRLGIDLLPTSHPLYVGRPGIKGDRAANFAVQNADLLVCVGTRLSINLTGHDYAKFARGAKVIVVDADPVEHAKKTIRIDRFVLSDAARFFDAMLKRGRILRPAALRGWQARCAGWKKRYPVVLPEYRSARPLNTYYFAEALSRAASPRDVIVIDSGSSSYVMSQAVSIKKGQRYLASGGLGAMGYAVPAAIGVSAALGGGRVLCITGDGSMHMNLQELETISHNRLPVKMFVFNNGGYASIKTTQRNFFGSLFVGVDEKSGVSLPDWKKTADLFRVGWARLDDPKTTPARLKRVLAAKGPVLCEVICSADQAIIPTVYSIKKPDGRMVSRPLEDMFPFLERGEFLSQMIVPAVED